MKKGLGLMVLGFGATVFGFVAWMLAAGEYEWAESRMLIGFAIHIICVFAAAGLLYSPPCGEAEP